MGIPLLRGKSFEGLDFLGTEYFCENPSGFQLSWG